MRNNTTTTWFSKTECGGICVPKIIKILRFFPFCNTNLTKNHLKLCKFKYIIKKINRRKV